MRLSMDSREKIKKRQSNKTQAATGRFFYTKKRGEIMAYDGTLTLDTALNASDFKERVDGLDKGLGALVNGLDAFKLI